VRALGAQKKRRWLSLIVKYWLYHRNSKSFEAKSPGNAAEVVIVVRNRSYNQTGKHERLNRKPAVYWSYFSLVANISQADAGEAMPSGIEGHSAKAPPRNPPKFRTLHS